MVGVAWAWVLFVGGCVGGSGLCVDGLLEEEVVPVGVAEWWGVEVRVGGVVGVVVCELCEVVDDFGGYG